MEFNTQTAEAHIAVATPELAFDVLSASNPYCAASWTHVFDFRGTEAGWDIGRGTVTDSGIGILHTYGADRRTDISRSFSFVNSTLTNISTVITESTGSLSGKKLLVGDDEVGCGEWYNYLPDTCDFNTPHAPLSWEGNVSGDVDVVLTFGSNYNGTNPILVEITLGGTGDNPFDDMTCVPTDAVATAEVTSSP